MKVKLILIIVLGIYLLTACTLPFTKYAHIAIVSPTPAITVNKETKIPESYIKNPDGMQTSTPSPESAAPPIITTVVLPSPTHTYSPTNTNSPSPSTSVTVSTTSTITLTATKTITYTNTSTITKTFTSSPTKSSTSSVSPGVPTFTFTNTPTRTITRTSTLSNTPTITTQTPTSAITRTATSTSTSTYTTLPTTPPPPTLTRTTTFTGLPPSQTFTHTATLPLPTSTLARTATNTSTATLVLPSLPPPTATSSRTPTTAPPASTASTCSPVQNSGFESQVIALINNERANAGVSPLSGQGQLGNAARGHSQDMACNSFFSHTGSDGSAFSTRITRAGYSYSAAAENIAAGYGDPVSVVSGWMGSQGHKDNILNPAYTEIGIGYIFVAGSPYGVYWTADFARP